MGAIRVRVEAPPGPQSDKDFERLLRDFNRAVSEDGVILEARRREYFTSKSRARREKHQRAVRRLQRQEQRRQQND